MTRPLICRDRLTPAEQRELERCAHWGISLQTLDEDSRDMVNGVEIPILGQDVELALEYSIRAASRMLEHPDPAQRWQHDVAFFAVGRLLAIVRIGPDGPVVTRFDPITLPSIVTGIPGSRRGRRPCIYWVDGSLEATSYGVGTPIAGRDPAILIDELVGAMCEKLRHPDADHRQTEDVIITHRGQILAAIRSTASGPVVTRFDQTDSSAGSLADPPDGPEPSTVPFGAGGQDRMRRSTVGRSPPSDDEEQRIEPNTITRHRAGSSASRTSKPPVVDCPPVS